MTRDDSQLTTRSRSFPRKLIHGRRENNANTVKGLRCKMTQISVPTVHVYATHAAAKEEVGAPVTARSIPPTRLRRLTPHVRRHARSCACTALASHAALFFHYHTFRLGHQISRDICFLPPLPSAHTPPPILHLVPTSPPPRPSLRLRRPLTTPKVDRLASRRVQAFLLVSYLAQMQVRVRPVPFHACQPELAAPVARVQA